MHFLIYEDFEFNAGKGCTLWWAETGVKSADRSRCTVDGIHLYPLLKTHYRGRDVVRPGSRFLLTGMMTSGWCGAPREHYAFPALSGGALD